MEAKQQQQQQQRRHQKQCVWLVRYGLTEHPLVEGEYTYRTSTSTSTVRKGLRLHITVHYRALHYITCVMGHCTILYYLLYCIVLYCAQSVSQSGGQSVCLSGALRSCSTVQCSTIQYSTVLVQYGRCNNAVKYKQDKINNCRCSFCDLVL